MDWFFSRPTVGGNKDNLDMSSPVLIVAAIPGRRLALRMAELSASADTHIRLLDADGNVMKGRYFIGVRGGIVIGPFEPRSFRCAEENQGIYAQAADSNPVTVSVEAYTGEARLKWLPTIFLGLIAAGVVAAAVYWI